MWHLGQIKHVGLVGDGLADGTRQGVFVVLELLRSKHALHGDGLRLLVRHFDTDGSLAGDRGDNADAQGGQTQGDIILQILDLGNTYTGCRNNLIQRHSGTNGGFNLVNLDTIVTQGFNDFGLVGFQLLVAHLSTFVAIFIQQIECGELIVAQLIMWIERRVNSMMLHSLLHRLLLRRVLNDKFYLISRIDDFQRHVVGRSLLRFIFNILFNGVFRRSVDHRDWRQIVILKIFKFIKFFLLIVFRILAEVLSILILRIFNRLYIIFIDLLLQFQGLPLSPAFTPLPDGIHIEVKLKEEIQQEDKDNGKHNA